MARISRDVYYRDFKPPPAGDHFDVDNGTSGTYFAGPNPNWIERTDQEIFELLIDEAGKAALEATQQPSEKGLALLNDLRADALSVLTVFLNGHDDPYVHRISDEIEKAKVLNVTEIANAMSPKGQVITRDMRAIQQGNWAPPHAKVQARVTAALQPAAHCRDIAGKLQKLSAHILRIEKRDTRANRLGTNIFIGHGRSPVWRDLKDFVQDIQPFLSSIPPAFKAAGHWVRFWPGFGCPGGARP